MKKNGMMVKMILGAMMMASVIGTASARANSDTSGKPSQDKAAVQTLSTSGQSDSSPAQSQAMREIVRVR